MTSALDVAVDALATYRLTKLAVDDRIADGPRRRLVSFAETRGHGDAVDYFTTCWWCTSTWIGLGVATARTFAPRAWDPIARALAASAVTGLASQHL